MIKGVHAYMDGACSLKKNGCFGSMVRAVVSLVAMTGKRVAKQHYRSDTYNKKQQYY
jgi:hypothetical protein